MTILTSIIYPTLACESICWAEFYWCIRLTVLCAVKKNDSRFFIPTYFCVRCHHRSIGHSCPSRGLRRVLSAYHPWVLIWRGICRGFKTWALICKGVQNQLGFIRSSNSRFWDHIEISGLAVNESNKWVHLSFWLTEVICQVDYELLYLRLSFGGGGWIDKTGLK